MAEDQPKSVDEAIHTTAPHASTSWAVVAGSLQQAVAFDTSSSFDLDNPDAAVSAAKGVVILRAPSNESGPCDIHLCFQQEHYIHRVYVRSSARVYEIYHALESPPIQSNEYLCTVRCGKALTEMFHEIDEQNILVERNRTDESSVHVPNILQTVDNYNGSNEDDWIEVKAPDSPIILNKNDSLATDVHGKGTLKTQHVQICYEAFAEISDLSPCMSLTLRLLSLQKKSLVYIEEIYIEADPLKSETNVLNLPTNLGSNLGGTSLLTMLVPGLLQLSRSGNMSLKDKGSSDMHESVVTEQTERVNPNITGDVMKEEHFTKKYFSRVQEPPIQSNPETADPGYFQEAPICYSETSDKFFHSQNNVGYCHTEKLLEELLSRVGRIEDFCLGFEEKMAKPILSIELKLQKLEQQLALLTARSNYTEPPRSSKFSAPEFSCDESGFVNKDCEFTDSSAEHCRFNMQKSQHLSACEMCPGFVVRAPEFVHDIPSCSNATSNETEILDEERGSLHGMTKCHHDKGTDAAHDRSLDLKNEINTEFKASIFTAPDFSSEDFSTCNNTSSPTERSHPEKKSALSIAASLALEALLLSSATGTTGSDCPLDPQEPSCGDNKNTNLTAAVPSGNHEIQDASLAYKKKECNLPTDTENLDASNDGRSRTDLSGLVSNLSLTSKEINLQDGSGDFVSGCYGPSESPTDIAIKIPNEKYGSVQSWHSASEATYSLDGCFLGSIDEICENKFPLISGKDIGVTVDEVPTLVLQTEGLFVDSNADGPDQYESEKELYGECNPVPTGNGLTDLHTAVWSPLSILDSVETQLPLPSWLTDKGDCDAKIETLDRVTYGDYHLNAGPDAATLDHMQPTDDNTVEREHQCLTLDFENLQNVNETSNSLYHDLLSELWNIEVQSCDNETKGDQNSLQYSTECCCSPRSTDQPLIDMGGF